MARIGFDPASASHSTAKFLVGGLYLHAGNWYVYLQNQDAQATVVGDVQCYDDASGGFHRGGSGDASSKVAGIPTGIIQPTEYGFLQVTGEVDVHVPDTTAAGAFILSPGADDGEADTTVAGSEHLVFGHTLEAEGATTEDLALCKIYGLI
jgi:hypothetical protein